MIGAGGMALLCTAVVLGCIGVVSSLNPGFQAKITAAGLNYANENAIEQLSASMKDKKFNIPSGKAGKVSFSVTDAEITEFSVPTPFTSLKPIQGSGLQWSAANIRVSMKANFKYTVHKFIKFSDHGRFDVSVSRVSFIVRAIFGMDTTGRPSIKAGPCSSDIGSLSLKFHGGMSWIYNLLRGIFEHKIKDVLNDKMCDVIGKLLNENAEKSLSSLKVTASLGKLFQLDYTLTDSPKFTSSYMETYHKGEIDWKSAPSPPPFHAPPLPPWNDTSRMMYVWVSDYMMNSLLYQAQKHNFLSYNMTAQDLPAGSRGVLNTTCTDSICIGNFIPALQKKYPNCQLELLMKSTKKSDIAVVNGAVETRMYGSISLYASPVNTLHFKPGIPDHELRKNIYDFPPRQAGNSGNYILTMDANMTMTGKISVDDRRMHFKVNNMSIAVSLQNSAVSNVTEKALNFLIKYAVQKFVQPSIDELGQIGIPLPLGKVTLKNAEVVLLKHAFIIATDVEYHPDDKF